MHHYQLGEFEVRPAERVVLRSGVPLPLGARAFDLLLAFIEHPDRLLTKGELMSLVWPGVVVEENNLTVQMSALRKLLGAEALATVSGRGYQLKLPVLALRPVASPGSTGSPGSAPHSIDRRAASLAEPPASVTAAPTRPWIVVLPFTNMDGKLGRDYFADGLVEDLTTMLARTGLFYVIARNTAFTYAG